MHKITIEDAAKDFGGIQFTPTSAITMGIATIMHAKEIVIACWGQNKETIVKRAIEGAIDENVPASYLQAVPSVKWVLDKAAAADLAQVPG